MNNIEKKKKKKKEARPMKEGAARERLLSFSKL
jgi:hypothetical protein